jgi:UDP-3-O-[3-hydroxymyristoyl] glucosamine N-acyltransferase
VRLSGSCTFGKNVVVGGQSGFGERCKLEDGAIIGGQSGVLGNKTIRSGETVWGTPARSLEKFKEQFAWQARLPELAARIKNLENNVRK